MMSRASLPAVGEHQPTGVGVAFQRVLSGPGAKGMLPESGRDVAKLSYGPVAVLLTRVTKMRIEPGGVPFCY